jgi:hypothetical protein
LLEAALRAQLIALKESTALAFVRSEKAIDKAEAATKERFAVVNGIRSQAASCMPRVETEALLANLNEKINVLTTRVDGFLAVRR